MFPSLYEAFGLALVEAMATGCPVIASDHPALVEVLDQTGANLRLDEDLWKDKILDWLSNPQKCEKIGKEGQLRAKRFGHEEMAKSFLSLALD